MLINRREFLKSSLGTSTALALAAPVPGFLCGRASGAAKSSGAERVLVMIELPGGNDGLNTVVPYEDEAYRRARPTLRLAANRVLKLEGGLGLHPEMSAMQRLYENGLLTIVQGVGYPDSNRDHNGAKWDWHSAHPADTLAPTGWVGRAIDDASDFARGNVPGIFVGTFAAPFALHAARAVVPSLRVADDFLPSAAGAGASSTLREQVTQAAEVNRANGETQLLDFIQSVTLEACAYSRRLQDVLDSAEGARREYPPCPLAQSLKSVARLIRAELGIRFYYTEQGGGDIGGFDTHAGQAINHGALLRELSEAVAAFIDDLRQDRLLDSVLVMTISEFGRTLSENGRRGTDHGAAAPVLLAGGRLKRRVSGSHPSLVDLDRDAPKFHTDFRRVYATVLEDWLGFNSELILGGKFPALENLLA